MCTAATYKTKDFYFGRTLDYEFSYGDEITITPRNYPFHFRHSDKAPDSHYAIIGMLMWPETIHSTMMPLMKKVSAWQV